MKRHAIALVTIAAPTGAFAKVFDRPMPMPQSATAELWFLLASLALVAALFVVHWIVKNR